MHGRIRRAVTGLLGRGRALSYLLILAACWPGVGLEPVTFAELQRRLEGLRGHIVVVEVWATWCVPCIERFPQMVEMHRRYRDRGVRFVSVSVDNREDKPAVEAARRFLRQQNAAFDNYLLDENILQAFEKLDISGIPAVFVYDRAGRQRHKLTGDDPNRQFTAKDVEGAVQALLREL